MFNFISLLTEADGSQQTKPTVRGEAGWVQGLQDVVREGESNHGLVSGVDDQHCNPQAQKPETQHR